MRLIIFTHLFLLLGITCANASDVQIINTDAFSIAVPASWEVDGNGKKPFFGRDQVGHGAIATRAVEKRVNADSSQSTVHSTLIIEYLILSPQADEKQSYQFREDQKSLSLNTLAEDKTRDLYKTLKKGRTTGIHTRHLSGKTIVQSLDIESSADSQAVAINTVCSFLRIYDTSYTKVIVTLQTEGHCDESTTKNANKIFETITLK